jgi:hypothetical protein
VRPSLRARRTLAAQLCDQPARKERRHTGDPGPARNRPPLPAITRSREALSDAGHRFASRAISTLDFVLKDGNLERYTDQARAPCVPNCPRPITSPLSWPRRNCTTGYSMRRALRRLAPTADGEGGRNRPHALAFGAAHSPHRALKAATDASSRIFRPLGVMMRTHPSGKPRSASIAAASFRTVLSDRAFRKRSGVWVRIVSIKVIEGLRKLARSAAKIIRVSHAPTTSPHALRTGLAAAPGWLRGFGSWRFSARRHFEIARNARSDPCRPYGTAIRTVQERVCWTLAVLLDAELHSVGTLETDARESAQKAPIPAPRSECSGFGAVA